MNKGHVKTGTLTDSDIIEFATAGHLITENFYDKQAKQACYELRASNIYYYPLESTTRQTVDEGSYILIKPKQIVVIITLESIHLDDDILARILTKGKLFSIGLSAVNTYADPGFDGNLGIVLCNLSNNYLKIYPNEGIAKIEFTRLSAPVKTRYNGQHGYRTEIWPIPIEMILTAGDITKDKRIGNPIDEIRLSFGEQIATLVERICKFERYLLIFASLYFVFTFSIYFYLSCQNSSSSSWKDSLVASGLGVAGSLIASIIVYYATIIRRQK